MCWFENISVYCDSNVLISVTRMWDPLRGGTSLKIAVQDIPKVEISIQRWQMPKSSNIPTTNTAGVKKHVAMELLFNVSRYLVCDQIGYTDVLASMVAQHGTCVWFEG
jgi:hypothetical protein